MTFLRLMDVWHLVIRNQVIGQLDYNINQSVLETQREGMTPSLYHLITLEI